MLKPLRDNRWFDQAACKGLPPAVFYPEDVSQWEHAGLVRDLCASCPVRTECIDYSVTSPYEESGWWGLPPEDREKLRKLYKRSINDITEHIDQYAVGLTELDNYQIG